MSAVIQYCPICGAIVRYDDRVMYINGKVALHCGDCGYHTLIEGIGKEIAQE